MSVYATNITSVSGVIKTSDGADYIVPSQITNFVIGSIDINDIVFQSSYLVVTDKRQDVVGGGSQHSPSSSSSYLFMFKGYIKFSTDFPDKHHVSKGDSYIVRSTSVVDSSSGKTNTGQVFTEGDSIFWNGDEWEVDVSETGLSWQLPVESKTNTPPTSPLDGDRYIIDSSPTGVWAGAANKIGIYDTDISSWTFVTPEPNWAVIVKDLDVGFTYDSDTSQWIQFTGTTTFNAGAGLLMTGLTLDVEVAPAGGLGFDASGDSGRLKVSNIDGGTF